MQASRSRERARPSDDGPIVIAVMGETGAGKSDFVGRITGEPTHVNASLTPQARGVIAYSLPLPPQGGRPNRSVQLLDCPGFDNGGMPDRDIISAIIEYLRTHYRRSQVHGIIYMIDITRPRLTGRALVDLEIFKELCGKDYYKNVVLGTTHWDQLRQRATGQRREDELKTVPGFWGTMFDQGSKVRRIMHTNGTDASDADMMIIHDIANNYQQEWLRVQEEMNRGVETSETSAMLELDEWERFYGQLRQLKRDSRGHIRQHKMQLRTEREAEAAMMNEGLRTEELRFAEDRAQLRDQERKIRRLADEARARQEQNHNGSPRTNAAEISRLEHEKHRRTTSIEEGDQRELERVLQTCIRYGRGRSARARPTSFPCNSKKCTKIINSTTERFYRE